MVKNTNFAGIFRRQPWIFVGAIVVVLLLGFKAFSSSKPEYVEKGGVISNVGSGSSGVDHRQAEALIGDENSGIVSFDMYVPQKKSQSTKTLSRAESIQRIIESVSGITDDMKAQNFIIDQITSLSFKIGGAELADILEASKIRDDFYYSNIIKRVAPLLEYPMTERQMKGIVEPIKDDYYRHKMHDVLVREQSKNK